MTEFTFSFIIPTRGRPESLSRLCDSIRAHTSHPDHLEIVFVMDSDDQASLKFEYAGLKVRKVEVAPAMTMGELNIAGYRAARGQYLMLLNDDVVLRTPAWDERVLEIFHGYPDAIVLVHVSDNIFREKLCTFPFLTRSFCELAHGICPSVYLRYRIDDHIHNVFDLLTLLGQRRRIFLPDVIFEHRNFVDTDRVMITSPIRKFMPSIRAFSKRCCRNASGWLWQPWKPSIDTPARRSAEYGRRDWHLFPIQWPSAILAMPALFPSVRATANARV
jgi:glycosyltransferase involved in cell wall biosynthesis